MSKLGMTPEEADDHYTEHGKRSPIEIEIEMQRLDQQSANRALLRKLETMMAVTVSTSHLPQEFAKRLNYNTEYPDAVIYEKGEYGWFFYIDGPSSVAAQTCPEITPLLQRMRDLGFSIVIFDRDGPVVEEFKNYDW